MPHRHSMEGTTEIPVTKEITAGTMMTTTTIAADGDADMGTTKSTSITTGIITIIIMIIIVTKGARKGW